MNYEKSIYFCDKAQEQYFLFQIVNFGKDCEHLKFIFTSHKDATSITYTESADSFEGKDIITQHAEITYHSDGSILHKFPKHNNSSGPFYVNPFGTGIRKLSLKKIRDWIPVINYKISDYSLCRKKKVKFPVMIPQNEVIFDGSPFECIIYLGHMDYANPPNDNPTEMLFRLNNVAKNLDLIIWLFKTAFCGQKHRIPNTTIDIVARNVIQVVEKKV